MPHHMQSSYKEQADALGSSEVEETRKLVVFNDDINTFDHVIRTLVQVCDHTPQQAEQCAWIIHNRGEYAVKEGSVEDLSLPCRLIRKANIHAEVL